METEMKPDDIRTIIAEEIEAALKRWFPTRKARAPKTAKFTPPSWDEAFKYIRKECPSVDPQTFWDFYRDREWYGVVNWKNTAQTWERREKKRNKINQKRITQEW